MNINSPNRKALVMCASLMALAYAMPAAAAEPGAARKGSAQAASNVDEVVVTAQRRSERLVDVPISITSQNSEQLTASGVTGTLNLQQVVPGLIINRFGNFTAPAIRGISTRVVGAGSDNNVATYVDGFYMPNAVGINRGFSDVAQIDILKGPQGTLFGRNATGGALMIQTRNPEFHQVLEANANAERFNGYGADIFATTPLTSTLALSVTAAHTESDGYLRNIPAGFQFPSAPNYSTYLKGKLLWNPSDKLQFLLTLDGGKQNDGAATALTYFAHPNATAPSPILVSAPYQTTLTQPQKLTNAWRGAYLKATADLRAVTLTSYTGYRKEHTLSDVDFDGTTGVRAAANGLLDYRLDTFTQEFNLANADKEQSLQWVLGAYYYKNNYFTEQRIPSPSHFGVKTQSISAFADATYEPGENLFLTAGIRYSSEEKECLVAIPASATGPLVSCLGGDPKRTASSWTPRAVIRYQLDPSTNVYASFSRGFKSGNFNSGTAANFVQPETVTAYEVGFKTSRNGVHLDTAAFYYDYKNIQYGSACVTAGCPAATISQNAASSRIYGAEATVSGNLTDRLKVNASLSYLHARFESFPNATTAAPSGPLLTSPNINVPGGQDWSGQQLIRAPDWSFNVGVSYDQPTSFGDFTLTSNLYYVDEYATNSLSLPCITTGCGAGLSPRVTAPAHVLVNGTIGWTSPSGHLLLSGYVRNLLDKKYILQTDGSTIGDWRVYGEPRVVGVRLGVRY